MTYIAWIHLYFTHFNVVSRNVTKKEEGTTMGKAHTFSFWHFKCKREWDRLLCCRRCFACWYYIFISIVTIFVTEWLEMNRKMVAWVECGKHKWQAPLTTIITKEKNRKQNSKQNSSSSSSSSNMTKHSGENQLCVRNYCVCLCEWE